ncbi:MAG: 50S ribosomal protein L18 [Chthoniobacterales bacterium]
MSNRIQKRQLRHTRLRKKITGTGERPRLSVYFSGQHINAQVIDDLTGKTLVSVHTTEADLASDSGTRANVATAEKVGRILAERGAAKNIKKIVFDRGGYRYHGKVKALADAAREAGFEF